MSHKPSLEALQSMTERRAMDQPSLKTIHATLFQIRRLLSRNFTPNYMDMESIFSFASQGCLAFRG
jgi:hypothetical protein